MGWAMPNTQAACKSLPVTDLGLDIVGTGYLDHRRTMTLSAPVPYRCKGGVSNACISNSLRFFGRKLLTPGVKAACISIDLAYVSLLYHC